MVLKKFFAILLGGVLFCTGITASAYAETTSSLVEDEIMPAYEIAINAVSTLTVSGQTAYCTSEIRSAEIVSITVEQTLQKHNFWWLWSDVKGASWTKTVNMRSISFSNTKSNLSSGQYRLKSVFTLTDKYGKTETITEYSAVQSI